MTVWLFKNCCKKASAFLRASVFALMLLFVLGGCAGKATPFDSLPAASSFSAEISESYDFLESCAVGFAGDRLSFSFIVNPAKWEENVQANEKAVEEILKKAEELLGNETFRAESEEWFRKYKKDVSFDGLKARAGFALKGEKAFSAEGIEEYRAETLSVYQKERTETEWRQVYSR